MKKPPVAVPEDWIDTVIEFEDETLREIKQKLARGGDVELSPAERAVLLAKLEGRLTKRAGRPPAHPFDDVEIASYCFKLEAGGMPVEAAVADTRAKFGVKRSKVFAARSLPKSK
jgi:hypothetical protein